MQATPELVSKAAGDRCCRALWLILQKLQQLFGPTSLPEHQGAGTGCPERVKTAEPLWLDLVCEQTGQTRFSARPGLATAQTLQQCKHMACEMVARLQHQWCSARVPGCGLEIDAANLACGANSDFGAAAGQDVRCQLVNVALTRDRMHLRRM